MISVDYPGLLDNFKEHLDAKRSESASFLIWYLEKYYRLDPQEAIDAVCDQAGDKGVDGIFVNDNDQTITVFQSKISHKSNSSVGDAHLRNFLGTLQQFDSEDRIQHLVETCGAAQVGDLIKRSDVKNKIATHSVVGEFVINLDLDQNGIDFLDQYGEAINFVGKKDLIDTYISDERDIPKHNPALFDVFGIEVAEHVVDQNSKAIIAPVKAQELVKLEGIADQSLFAYNVRGPLGKTKVNKDMTSSITDKSKHKMFPLFHNGITIIAKIITKDENKIQVEDYHVVNGCQSISTMFNHQSHLTSDLRVLTKIIQMDPASSEAKMITEFSNNQNGVRPRDFKSNHQTQIRIQREFDEDYKNVFAYEIKRGEHPRPGTSISNEEAGLLLMAFDLREPWATHRKYEVFEDKHGSLFGRPDVTADRIVMLKVISDAVNDALELLEDRLLAQYALTKYMMVYSVRECFKDDSFFQDVIKSPENFVKDPQRRAVFQSCIKTFADDLIIDLNSEAADFGKDFDYRGRLRDNNWAKEMTKLLVKDYLKQKGKGKALSFAQAWEQHAATI